MIKSKEEAEQLLTEFALWAQKEYGVDPQPSGMFTEFLECSADKTHYALRSPFHGSCYESEWVEEKRVIKFCRTCGAPMSLRTEEMMQTEVWWTKSTDMFYEIMQKEQERLEQLKKEKQDGDSKVKADAA